MKPLDFDGGPEIVCETLAEGPYGIESQADVDSVAMPLRRLVEGDNQLGRLRHRLLQRSRACMSAAKPPTGPCSASPNAAC